MVRPFIVHNTHSNELHFSCKSVEHIFHATLFLKINILRIYFPNATYVDRWSASLCRIMLKFISHVFLSGNAKLFNRDRDYESWRPCYYNRAKLLQLGDDMAIDDTSKTSRLKPLFYEDASVLEFMQLCDLASGTKKLVCVN